MDVSAIALLAAGLSVLLLLIFMLRLQKRFQSLSLELSRLGKTQKEGTLDARKRIDEATGVLSAIERKVEDGLGKVDGLKEDVSGRVEGIEASVAKLAPTVDAAGKRGDEVGKALDEAKQRILQAEGTAKGAGERVAKVDASMADAQTRLKGLEGELREMGGSLDQRFEKLETRYREVGMAIRKMQDEDTVEDVSGEAIAEAMAAEMRARRIAGAAAKTRGAPPGSTTAPKPEVAGAKTVDEAGKSPRPDKPVKPVHEDSAGSMHWVLILVIGLAGLTVLLHFLGVGK